MTNKWRVNLLVADFIFLCFLIDFFFTIWSAVASPTKCDWEPTFRACAHSCYSGGVTFFSLIPIPSLLFFPLINHGLSITPFLDKPWFFLSRIQWSAGSECLDLMPYGCLVLTMLGLLHRLHHLLLFKFSVCFSRYPYLCIHLLGIWTASCSYYTWNIHMLHPICLVFA